MSRELDLAKRVWPPYDEFERLIGLMKDKIRTIGVDPSDPKRLIRCHVMESPLMRLPFLRLVIAPDFAKLKDEGQQPVNLYAVIDVCMAFPGKPVPALGQRFLSADLSRELEADRSGDNFNVPEWAKWTMFLSFQPYSGDL